MKCVRRRSYQRCWPKRCMNTVLTTSDIGTATSAFGSVKVRPAGLGLGLEAGLVGTVGAMPAAFPGVCLETGEVASSLAELGLFMTGSLSGEVILKLNPAI